MQLAGHVPTLEALTSPAYRQDLRDALLDLDETDRKVEALRMLDDGSALFLQTGDALALLLETLTYPGIISRAQIKANNAQTYAIVEECSKNYNKHRAARARMAIEHIWGDRWFERLGFNDCPKSHPLLAEIMSTAKAYPDLNMALEALKDEKSMRERLTKRKFNNSKAFYAPDFEAARKRKRGHQADGERVRGHRDEQPNQVRMSEQTNVEPTNKQTYTQMNKQTNEHGVERTDEQTTEEHLNECTNEQTTDEHTNARADQQETEDLWAHDPTNATQHKGHDKQGSARCNPMAPVVRKHLLDATVITLDFTVAEMMPSRGANMDRGDPESWKRKVAQWDAAVTKLNLIDGTTLLKPSDGEILAYKFSEILSEGPHAATASHLRLRQAFQKFQRTWINRTDAFIPVHPLPAPPRSDHRHNDYPTMLKQYGRFDCGVFHLCHWIPLGGTRPVLSADCGSSVCLQGVARFYKDIEGYQSKVNHIFNYLEPQNYKRYARSMENARANDYSAAVFGPKACFSSTALVHNLRVLPHRDLGDDGKGFVAMTPFGQFTGGDLILGCEGNMQRLRYEPNDLVLFRSAVVQHAIGRFEGTRTALVFFTHQADLGYQWRESSDGEDLEESHLAHQQEMDRMRALPQKQPARRFSFSDL